MSARRSDRRARPTAHARSIGESALPSRAHSRIPALLRRLLSSDAFAEDQLVIARLVEILDPSGDLVSGSLVETDRPSVRLLRRSLDQEHSSAAPLDFLLRELDQLFPKSTAMVLRVHRDPVEIVR